MDIVDGVKITFATRDEGRSTAGGSLFSSDDGPCVKSVNGEW